jgi:kynureninase
MATAFEAIPTVESWQLSNAPILPMAALRASLDVIDKAGGMPALRQKSEQQIEFFDRRLTETLGGWVVNITPKALSERGCQFALRVTNGDGKRVFDTLEEARVLCDWREPDVIRVAPVPLYNSFDDIDRFVTILDGIVQ